MEELRIIVQGLHQLWVDSRPSLGLVVLDDDKEPARVAIVNDERWRGTASFQLMESSDVHGSPCISCNGNVYPTHETAYVIQQQWHQANPSGMLSTTIHGPCVERFVTSLEEAWEHADVLLGG